MVRAAEGEGSEFPFVSTGKQAYQERLNVGKGATKGTLFYEAEFIPAKKVKGLKFERGPNQIQRMAQSGYDTEGGGGTVGSDDDDSSSDDEAQAVPQMVTIRSPISPTSPTSPKTPASVNGNDGTTSSVTSGSTRGHRKSKSTDTTGTVTTVDTSISKKSSMQKQEEEDDGIEMSTEELLQQRTLVFIHLSEHVLTGATLESGVVIFNVISGRLQKKARLEVLLDDAYWPAFSTVRPPSVNAQWETIGEGFIKELDFSRVWLRLDLADEGDKDDIIAEWKGDAKAFLQKTLVWTCALSPFGCPHMRT